MPDQLKRKLDEYAALYLADLVQDEHARQVGRNTLIVDDDVDERQRMLKMMSVWARDNSMRRTENLFTKEFENWSKPLRTERAERRLQAAADSARQGHKAREPYQFIQRRGVNVALNAQIAEAAKIRAERTTFLWGKDVSYQDALAKNILSRESENNKARLQELWRQEGRVVKGAPISRVKGEMQLNALQAMVLDALLHEYEHVSLLFTTWKLLEGNNFLRVLGTSQRLFEAGVIMNPNSLHEHAPSGSPIEWDIRLNDYFIHSGIAAGAAFVFVTPGVDYETFFDPSVVDRRNRQKMFDAPIGSFLPGLGLKYDKNYPVKPGGSEILTLLEWGYGLEPSVNQTIVGSDIGFVLLPGVGQGARQQRFMDIHGSNFNADKHKKLMEFIGVLKDAGIYRSKPRPPGPK